VDGSLNELTYASGTTLNYAYDQAQRQNFVADLINNIGYVDSATFAPPGQMTGFLGGTTASFSGITSAFNYNKRLQPTAMSATTSASTIFSLGYTYGPTGQDNGNVSTMTNNLDSTRTVNFNYDSLNRIANALTTNWGEAYVIDAWGNMTAINSYQGKAHESLSCGPANTQNRLNTCYSYDSAGNLTQNGSSAYTYDGEGRLSGTAGWTYVYDGDGKRVKKAGSYGTLYWPDTAGHTLGESDLSGNPQSDYVFFNGTRIARFDVKTLAVHYYFSNHLGSHTVVTNATGTCEQDIEYYPYGGQRSQHCATPVAQNYKFTGKERDTESGLDNFGKRYNASSMGRFMTPDPVFFQAAMLSDPQRFNQYAYVRNSPLALVDPRGESIELTGDEEERKKQLQALQQAVGTQAGSYLYQNAVTTTDANGNSTTKYYVGVYTNGPSGQGPAFGSINSASGAIGNIISDSRVAQVNLVQAGTQVVNEGGGARTIGPVNTSSNATPAATYFGQDGQWHVALLDTSTTSPGQLPADVMSNGEPGALNPGIMIGHELGHIRYEWGGFWRQTFDSSNDSAVRLENNVRAIQDPNGPTRIAH
jgi:RHS repeat-associated protein